VINRLLKSWRRQIPVMECEPGCRECCEGHAPAMILPEWREIKHPGKIVKDLKVLMACPFFGEKGCEIYARRPLRCRVFGTVARAELSASGLEVTLPVCCPRGHQPETPWPLKSALIVLVHYQKWFNQELQAVVADFRKWQRSQGSLAGAPVPPVLPAKFEWMYYVLCTREGQNNMSQLMGHGRPALSPEKLGRLAAVIGG
jgi:Fe-S-cluster containining protein